MSLNTIVDSVCRHINHWRAAHDGCLTVGICGAQGSGKSTVADGVGERLEKLGLAVAKLSLDDLYLAREGRSGLAETVHPLLRTRGVPGTHDVLLGERVLDGLKRGERLALPRFDKAQDEPLPVSAWPLVTGPVDVVLFEGWCVGAAPEPEEALAAPVNDLERLEDPAGVWRRYVNGMLGGDYQDLFARIDRLVFLAAPGFEVVADWRKQQEHELRAERLRAGLNWAQVMDDRAVERFVSHYERLTRHMLREMPGRADLVLYLDRDRRCLRAKSRSD